MTEPTTDEPRSESVDWFDDDTESWWVWLAPAGFVAGWAAMAAALAAGGWAAGDLVAPTPAVAVRTLWIALADGYRLDEAWLLASGATAVAPAAYLWVFFAAALAAMAAVATAAVQWWQAGRPTSLGAASSERRPSRRFRSRRWPLRPPYTPQRPGPGVLLGRDRGRLTVAGDGLPVLVVGPTGSGKTRHLIGPNVAHWPGPVVATSVKTDLAGYTVAHRAQRGRCFGFDPGGALWPWMRSTGITPVVWDPIRLLAKDPTHEHAKLLAQFLVSHSSAHDAGSQGIWSTLAGEVLASVLLIATDVGQPLKIALRWMIDVDGVFFNNKQNSEFATAVRESPNGRLSDDASRALRDLRLMAQNDPRIWGSIEVTIREVTGALTNTAEHHANAELVPIDVTVNRARQDTLFLVADHMTQTTYRSVFAALVRHLFHITESVHPGPGRLRSRPLFALDELANLARIEDLPEVLSTIRTCAQVIVGIQEISQLVSGWGRDKATTVVGNLPTRVILPGSSDASALRCWADLSGDDDNYALNTWRTINTGTARILAGNRDPFETKLSRPKRWMPTIDPPTQISPPPQPEPQQPAPCTGSDDASPIPATTRRPRRPPADQPSLFATVTANDDDPEPFDVHPLEPDPDRYDIDPADPDPEVDAHPVEPETVDVHRVEPDPEPGEEAVVPHGRRLWAGGSDRLRRGWDAMFGPLPEDPAEDQPASWASLAGRLGVADLLEPPGQPLNGRSPTTDTADVGSPAPDPAAGASTDDRTPALPALATQTPTAEGKPPPQPALSEPVLQQLRVVNDGEGSYGMHRSGFVVDLTPPESEDPEDASAIGEEAT